MVATPTNRQVADILDEIGTFLELRGENPFKCRAYHNASRIVAALTDDLRHLIDRRELENVKGIGQGLAEKIVELVTTGKLTYYNDLRKSFPPGLTQMLRIPGLGPKRLKILYDTLGVKGLDELKEAAGEHRLAGIEGFGKKTEENILRGIKHLQQHADKHLFSAAKAAADHILASLQGRAIQCEIGGSLRRRNETIGDIDILASVKKGQATKLVALFTAHPDVDEVVARGETKSSVRLKAGIACDLRVISNAEYPFALAYFTGSKEHNVAMRSRAKQFGWSLNEYGFSVPGAAETRGKAKRLVPCRSETELYKALRLQYVPPELRENMGEIEAARDGNLPQLIEEADLRGTFHCHTDYSDGNNTLEQMAGAARALGWEYLGIADHSKIAAYAGGLTEDRVRKQHKEIDRLNGGFSGFRIFKGTEVDILPDGSLDWSDRVLATFDFVVASIHSRFKMTEAEATRRVVRALKNRYVTMLGHPTGRLLLEREGYPLNIPEVIGAAADYGKVIEINSHPLRLDLDWRFCKSARERGVKLSINPDAHNINGLKDVYYGVGVARKGWLGKDDIINSRGARDVVAFLNRR